MAWHDIILGLGALAGVLALIWLTQRGLRVTGSGAATGGSRLRLVQTLSIDPKRRLVLLACDGREVLLLTGGATELVIPLPPAGGPA